MRRRLTTITIPDFLVLGDTYPNHKPGLFAPFLLSQCDQTPLLAPKPPPYALLPCQDAAIPTRHFVEIGDFGPRRGSVVHPYIKIINRDRLTDP